MTFQCPACYYLKTHFKGRLCASCSQVFEEKTNGKIGRKAAESYLTGELRTDFNERKRCPKKSMVPMRKRKKHHHE